MTKVELISKASERAELCYEIKELIVNQLNLEIPPYVITDDQSLFGRGLELDSIDALELSVGVDAKYDVTITDDNIGAYGSVNKLADFIMEQMEQMEENSDE